MKTKTYNVYMTAAAISYVFISFDNYDDALEFAALYDWKYVDENGFEWLLEIDAM